MEGIKRTQQRGLLEAGIFSDQAHGMVIVKISEASYLQQPLSDVVVEDVTEAVQFRLSDFAGAYTPGKRPLDFDYRKAGDVVSCV